MTLGHSLLLCGAIWCWASFINVCLSAYMVELDEQLRALWRETIHGGRHGHESS